jgi:AsmA protein
MNDLPTSSNQQPRRARRPARHLAAALLIAVIAIPLLGAAVVTLTFDPNRLAPLLVTAVKRATGRDLTITGPISLHLSLTPTLEASQISLSNPPGYPDPSVLTLDRVEAKIALLPLLSHHIEILRLELIAPHITLERLSDGRANWDFAPQTPGLGPAQPFHRSGYTVALEAVEIRDGTLTLRLTPTVPAVTIAMPHVTGMADSLTAPLHITADAQLGTSQLTLDGVTGPIGRFSGLGSGPWPVNLKLQFAGASASLSGAINSPRTGQGYDLSIEAAVPALETLGTALSATPLGVSALPPLHDVAFSARIMDSGSPIRDIEAVSLTAGPSDLTALYPGLALKSLSATMASLGQPIQLSGSGTLGTAPVTLSGSAGAPQTLLPSSWNSTGAPPASLPLELSLQIGGATAHVAGAIATPATLSGAALGITLTIPDLSTLGTAAGLALPAWKNINVQTTLIDPGGQGLLQAAGLDSLTATMDNAALGADASLYFGPKPRLSLAVTVAQANLDALRAAFPVPTPPAQPAPASTPATPPPLPSWPLPLALLKGATADIQLTANTLVWNNAPYTALQAHVLLSGSVLTLAPVSGELPGGRLSANAMVDASHEPATEAVHVSTPALALGPLLAMLGLEDTNAEGIVQAQLDATATGDTLPDIAASLTGQFGISSVNDSVDAAVLSEWLAPNAASSVVPVRCAAVRMDMANGTGTLRTLTLASAPLTLSGSGGVNFGLNSLTANIIASTAAGQAGQLQQITGSLWPLALAAQTAQLPAPPLPATPPAPPPAATDICPPALVLARMGQAGPMAAPASAVTTPAPSAPAKGTPANLLNAILSP